MTPAEAIVEIERKHLETVAFMDEQEKKAMAKISALANRYGFWLGLWSFVNVIWTVALLALSILWRQS